jgi:zinc and cadmium transporter
MSNFVLLAYYCVFILLASIVGGMIPLWVRLTHRTTEIGVSFVAGVMLGVALFHLLPHAISGMLPTEPGQPIQGALVAAMTWLLVGFLAMFFIERFFCYHHHDFESESDGHEHSNENCSSGHHHDAGHHVHHITWGGAALGLTLHSILEGVALAASVQHGHGATLAGLGTFMVIFLHKPLDAMTITTLMGDRWSPFSRTVANGLFALAVPLGMAILLGNLVVVQSTGHVASSSVVAAALAFSAGMFLCIAMSDLLPELQFHQHDRVKLSAALLLGLGVAWLAGWLELKIDHAHQTPPVASASADGKEKFGPPS